MTFYGAWERTPKFLTYCGFPGLRRRRWASPMIGGGFDGWQYKGWEDYVGQED